MTNAGYPDNNPKTLSGVQKVPMHLVPPSAKIALAEAFADGARKYGPYNWREKKVSASIYYAAFQRHVDAWWDGEDLSADSKIHHLNHAMACLAILKDAMSIDMLNDDRPFKGAASKLQEAYAQEPKKEPNEASTSTAQASTRDDRNLSYNELVKREQERLKLLKQSIREQGGVVGPRYTNAPSEYPPNEGYRWQWDRPGLYKEVPILSDDQRTKSERFGIDTGYRSRGC